ncbi:MAG: alpha-mannosidase [Ktedonobacteraceae bacterium]
MTGQLNIILVPHTHWDREWYQTFQQFRMRLVHAIDRLLDILDRDPAFTHFMLDGQTIVLEDYLEVRPENAERLKNYIRSGRIQVGPWYLQPDEFLVSGESLIRNLQIGLRQAAEYGGHMRAGYVPDTFGHIAQLPQILRGFDIDNVIFWRGIGAEAHKSEFYWKAPDGSQVLVIFLAGAMGYSNARDMPLDPEEFAARVELLVAPLLPKATTDTLLFMNGSDHLEPQEGLPKTIEAANALLTHIDPEREKLFTHYGHLDIGGQVKHVDSIHVRIGTLPQYIQAVQQQIEHSPGTSLQEFNGEMRNSQLSHLLPSILSTRMWIKQQNNATEHLLERWVEPLTAWAWKLGAPYPKAFVKLAWKHLLHNHPHDSICGCSIDEVHRENSVRFAQSQQIAENLVSHAIHHLASVTDTRATMHANSNQPHKDREATPIVVFNPAPGPRTEAVQIRAQLPGSLNQAVIVDEQGRRTPLRVVNRWRQELGSMPFAREMIAAAVALMGESAPGDFIHLAQTTLGGMLGQAETAYDITRVTIEEGQQPGVAAIEVMLSRAGNTTIDTQHLYAAERKVLDLLEREDINMLEFTAIDETRQIIDFVAADLPAYGLKTFWIYPHGLQGDTQPVPAASTDAGQGKAASRLSIENEFYIVEASQEDGTLTITDRQTHAVFTGLNRFMDGGDVGDLYNYCPPEHDLIVSKPKAPPKIELLNSGPVRSILRISGIWSLPRACATTRAERSGEMTDYHIASEIVLTPGVRRIDIHTTVENSAKDHRLRVTFPLPYAIQNAAAEGTFEVRMRPIAAPRPADVSEWIEEPINTFPQKRFVDASNGTIGLGVLNRGLPEYEIISNEAGQLAVAVTLLRCVEWLSRGDLSTRKGDAGPQELTPEAQCLGHHKFDYALVPHSGDWEAEEALVLREAQAFNTPIRSLVTEQHKGQLSSHSTLIEVGPPALVVSAIKQSESGIGMIVRVYNPLSHTVQATIQPGFAYTRAFVANLNEEPGEHQTGNQQGVPLHIDVRPGEIVTILFE